MEKHYIGLMSGTSMDSVDGVLITFNENPPKIKVLASDTLPIPKEIQKDVLSISQTGHITLQNFGNLDHIFGHLFADVCLRLLEQSKLQPQDVEAIGSHGQTLWHSPNNNTPFSLQIGDPNIIAQKTQIKTVADFRRADMAFGGQGAPLAPAFHYWLFGSKRPQVVVNIGGIANISLLPYAEHTELLGYDTGPGNGLIDAWTQKHYNQPFDTDGKIAATGKVNQKWLSELLSDSYFNQPAPKSTGKDYFNLSWLEQKINRLNLSHPDILCTLVYFTAQTIAQEIKKHRKAAEIIICGGGAQNLFLMQKLPELLGTGYSVKSSMSYGIDPKWIEACCFAWLARQRILNKEINLTHITGAKQNTTLGAIYNLTN